MHRFLAGNTPLGGWSCLLLVLFLLPVAAGCSGSNVGSVYNPYGSETDPGDEGFDPGSGAGDNGYNLYSLENGTVFSSGAPQLLHGYPEQGAKGVDVNTFVVLRFSESLNPDMSLLAKGFVFQKASDNSPVPGVLTFARGTAKTVLVFEPAQELEEEEEYQVSLTSELEDAQGTAFVPEGGQGSAGFGFTTGKAADDVPFEIIEPLVFPESGATDVSPGTSVLLFFTEAVKTGSGNSGIGGSNSNFSAKDQDGDSVKGARSFDYDDRLFVFTPTSPMPAGETIDIVVQGNVKNKDGSETVGQDFSFSFTVVGFPHVSEIAFKNNDPLVVLPDNIFDGRANKQNQHSIVLNVTTKGSGMADKLTLIFWDNDESAVISVNSGKSSAGTHSFTVDLKPGSKNILLDGTVTVGAYTAGGGVNSPVGPPIELPNLKKDVEKPVLISLGPPCSPGTSNLGILTEVPDPAIHGRAAEDLSAVKITAEFYGTEQDPVNALKFFSIEYPGGSKTYSDEVTRNTSNLFITTPLLDLDTGGLFPPAPGMAGRAEAPVTVTKIFLTDLVGNSKTYSNPQNASLDFRGYFYSLVSGAVELSLLCYDSVTLHPLENVDVIVDNLDLLDGQWAAHTSAEGAATVNNMAGSVLGDRILLTIVKDGCRILSYQWLYTGKYILASLPVVPESETGASVTLMIGNSTGADLPDVYFGGNALRTGSDDTLAQAGSNPSTAVLKAHKNRLQFLEGFGIQAGPPDLFQWAWSNPFVPDSDVVIQAVAFFTEPAEPLESQRVKFETELGDGATRMARLVSTLPGFMGTLPLGVDMSEHKQGDYYEFEIPLPPTLRTNQAADSSFDLADLEPCCEVVIDPELGPAANDNIDADESLLEEHLSFEAEEIGEGSPPAIVRKRTGYLEAELLSEIEIDLPPSMTVSASNPPEFEFQWDNVLEEFNQGDDKTGCYVLRLERIAAGGSGARHWDLFMSSKAAGSQAQKDFQYPDLDSYAALSGISGENDFTAFTKTGDYSFFVEGFHIESFDLVNGFISKIKRKWETCWRSEQVSVSKSY